MIWIDSPRQNIGTVESHITWYPSLQHALHSCGKFSGTIFSKPQGLESWGILMVSQSQYKVTSQEVSKREGRGRSQVGQSDFYCVRAKHWDVFWLYGRWFIVGKKNLLFLLLLRFSWIKHVGGSRVTNTWWSSHIAYCIAHASVWAPFTYGRINRPLLERFRLVCHSHHIIGTYASLRGLKKIFDVYLVTRNF